MDEEIIAFLLKLRFYSSEDEFERISLMGECAGVFGCKEELDEALLRAAKIQSK